MGSASSQGDGYFPVGSSVLRRIVSERAVGMWYGQRGLLMGALEPMAYTGTYQSTSVNNHGAYYQRMVSTSAMFNAVFYGDRATADAALRRVGQMHQQVNGTVPHELGPSYPAGSRYDAHDPWLSYWTMAVLADSATVLYETFVRALSPAEREANWQDWLLFGRLFGMPDDAAPTTWLGHRARIDGWIDSGAPHVLPKARRAGLSTLSLELPLPMRPFNHVGYLTIVGTLTPKMRELLDVPWGPQHAVAFQALKTATRAGRRVTPSVLATGRLDPLFNAAADIADRNNPATLASKLRDALPV